LNWSSGLLWLSYFISSRHARKRFINGLTQTRRQDTQTTNIVVCHSLCVQTLLLQLPLSAKHDFNPLCHAQTVIPRYLVWRPRHIISLPKPADVYSRECTARANETHSHPAVPSLWQVDGQELHRLPRCSKLPRW
jgi:hypothetical protein